MTRAPPRVRTLRRARDRRRRRRAEHDDVAFATRLPRRAPGRVEAALERAQRRGVIADARAFVRAALERAEFDERMSPREADQFGRGVAGRTDDVDARHAGA